MKALATVLIGAVAAVLAACSTPPSDDFHTLRGTGSGAQGAARIRGQALAIGPVTVPQALQRPGWVVREGDTAVRVYEHQLWTQDLQEEIAQAIADDLAADTGAAARPWADPAPSPALLQPDIAPAGALRVRLQVLRFDSRLAPAAGVSDDFRWTLECGTQESAWAPLRSAVRRANVPLAASPADSDQPGTRFDRLATAHAQVLALVATDIALALDETASERALHCPSAPGP